MHHRVLLSQQPDQHFAVLTEEDSADYLEGYTERPTVTLQEQIEQPALDRVVRSRVLGASVLTAETGSALDRFAWSHEYDVAAVMAHGQALIEAGNYLVQVDNAILNSFTAS